MELKPGYKLTEAGVIPEEWDAAPLKGRIEIAHGFPFEGQHFVAHGTYRLTTPGHFYEDGGFRDIGEKQKYYDGPVPTGYVLRLGDLIVAMTEQADGLLGSAALIPQADSYLHNQRLGRVKVGIPQINVQFLYYIFNASHFRSKVRETAAGTKVKHTSPQKLLDIAVPLPPLAEQRAIAGALSDVDALIGALDQLLAKKRDLKQAAMQQLLTGHQRLPGFAPANPRFQQTEAGEIPGDWAATPLGELGFWKGGMTPSMSNPAYWDNGTIPWASSGDIKTPVLIETGFKITALAVKQGTTTVLPPNSLIVVMRSGILRRYLPVALNPNAVAINQDIKGLIPNDKAVPTFMLHLLTHHGPPILASCMKAGTTVESIELRWLKAYCVPLPQSAEQTAIAEVLSDMDAELATLEQKRDKTRLLKQGMMQELLTGRTRLI